MLLVLRDLLDLLVAQDQPDHRDPLVLMGLLALRDQPALPGQQDQLALPEAQVPKV